MLSAEAVSAGVVLIALLCLVFSIFFGRKAERAGAVLIISGAALTWAAQSTLGSVPLPAFLLIDLAVAVGFAMLTAMYPEKLWPGIAGCAQFLVLIFSVTRAINFPLSPPVFLAAVSLSSFAVVAAVTAGAWTARWYRPPPDEWDLAAKKLAI